MEFVVLSGDQTPEEKLKVLEDTLINVSGSQQISLDALSKERQDLIVMLANSCEGGICCGKSPITSYELILIGQQLVVKGIRGAIQQLKRSM